MPKPAVLTGPPAPLREARFFARVVEWCTDVKRAAGLRYIVPTVRRRLEVETAILDSCSVGGVICQPRVETFDRFVCDLPAQHGNARLVSWRVAALVIDALLAHAPTDFPTLLSGRMTPFPGLVRGVVRSIRELKRAGVGAADVSREAKGDRRAAELAELLNRYNRFLAERQWADTRDAYAAVGKLFAEDAGFVSRCLPKTDWIVFDGFVEFSPSEAPIVEALADQIETTCVIDNDPELADLFPVLPPFLTAAEVKEHVGPFVSLARLAWRGADHAMPAASAPVTLVEGRTREDEVEQIASHVKALLRDGAAQADVALAVPDLEHYGTLVDETFAAHGVPCAVARRAPLLESPVAAAALLLLSVPARDFERHDLVRLFRSPFIRFERNGRAIEPAALDSLARTMRVFRGKDAWLDALDRRIAYLDELSADGTLSPRPEEDETGSPSPDEELCALRPLQELLDPALALLDALRAPRSAAQYVAALQDLLESFGVRRRVTELSVAVADAAVHMRSLEHLQAALAEMALLDEAHGQPRTVSLDAFIESIRSALGATRMPVDAPSRGIEVLDFRSAVERGTKHLFVAGLVEGAVPVPRPRDTILPPFVRARLELPDRERVAADGWIELYRLLASATESLTLCRPQTEGETPLLRPAMLERIVAARELDPEPIPRFPTSSRQLLCCIGANKAPMPSVEDFLSNDAFARNAPLAGFMHSRAVEAARRAATTTPTPYAGQLSPGLLDEVRRIYDRDHQFSATELETYAHCPFRFFAQWLLGLRPIDEPGEELPPHQKGTVLHEIFRAFYDAWSPDRTPRRITEDNRREALELLTAIAHRSLDKQPYAGFIWQKLRERLVGRQVAGEPPGLLERFIQEEMRTSALSTACMPKYLELGFGRHRPGRAPDSASREQPITIDAGGRHVLLRGIIDRVDTNDAQETFCVLDYKTGGSIPALKDMRSGPELQLPLYVMAAQAILGEAFHFAAAGYFQTKDAQDCRRRNWFGNKEYADGAVAHRLKKDATLEPAEINDWLAEEKALIGEAVTAIEAGRFHVTTLDETQAGCRVCDYKHICRFAGITIRSFRSEA